jgi:kynurenine formamidase
MRRLLIVTVLHSFACASAGANRVPTSARPSLAPNVLLSDHDVVDLSVLVSETLPAHWGANPAFQRWTNNWFAPTKNAYETDAVESAGPYYSQRYVIDEHTGTQTDFPAHFIPPPALPLKIVAQSGSPTRAMAFVPRRR